MRRGPVLVLLAVLAVLLQSTVLARLPLPGAAPDLLVAVGVALQPVLVTGALTVLAVLLHAGEGVLLSDPRVSGGALSRSLVSTVPYSALLSLVVFPPVGALLRRVDRRR